MCDQCLLTAGELQDIREHNAAVHRLWMSGFLAPERISAEAVEHKRTHERHRPKTEAEIFRYGEAGDD